MSKQKEADKTSVSKPVRDRTDKQTQKPKEIGGPRGKDPTRYGDWEKNGRCIDF